MAGASNWYWLMSVFLTCLPVKLLISAQRSKQHKLFGGAKLLPISDWQLGIESSLQTCGSKIVGFKTQKPV